MTQVSIPTLQSHFIKTRASGPLDARVMFCGEAPGEHEEIKGIPFVGGSGDELDKMLAESGFLTKSPVIASGGGSYQIGAARRIERDAKYFLTNVCKYRPPENKIEKFFLDSKQKKPNELILEGVRELKAEISIVKPELIICFGNTPMWALKGERGIRKWRGSMLDYSYQDADGVQRSALLMPTYHPAYILRDWAQRPITVHDLRRAYEAWQRGSWPERKVTYFIRPSFSLCMDVLGTLIKEANERTPENPLELVSDLETRYGYIACHGIAWDSRSALCIPRISRSRPTGHFSLDEDVALWQLERELLCHENVSVIGQSYLYDAQFFARRCGYVPRLRHDTRFMQHVAWPGLPQNLGFLSSMYCEHHVFWKDDAKDEEAGEWSPKVPEENLWTYNCTDVTRNYEVFQVLRQVLIKFGFWDLYQFQMRMWRPILNMMLRGVKRDQILLSSVAAQLMEATQERQNNLRYMLGHDINLGSPKQVHHLFYEQLKCPVQRHPKTRRPTCDGDALAALTAREPLLRPLTQTIDEVRSLDSMMSNVIMAKADADGRLRCEFSPLAETLRWKSRKNAWKGGTNMQNWTKGSEDDE